MSAPQSIFTRWGITLQPWQRQVLASMLNGNPVRVLFTRQKFHRRQQRRRAAQTRSLLEIGPEHFTGPAPEITFEPESQRTIRQMRTGQKPLCVGLGEIPAAKARLEKL